MSAIDSPAVAFRHFDHVERFGHLETHGLDDGLVHVFAKLDGSNGSVWLDRDGNIQCGSRNRKLGDGSDNHGFREFVLGGSPKADALRLALQPGRIYYGEWLVRHTITGYRDDAWRRFWIFDVFDVATGRYVAWNDYGDRLLAQNVDALPPIAVLDRPTSAQLLDVLRADRTLLKEGATGEGIVMKRYDWQNRFGRQPWAKLVNAESMGRNRATRLGLTSADVGASIEAAIASKFITPELIEKVRSKSIAEIAEKTKLDLQRDDTRALVESQYRGHLIPQLLGRVYTDLIREEMWTIVKEGKDPRIDFGLLRRSVQNRTKELAADLFGIAPAPVPAEVPALPVAEDAIGGGS